MEQLEILLGKTGNAVSLLLEFISVICIVVGFITASYLLIKKQQVKSTPLHRRVKLQFGGWLSLALEFQLASDIVKTTIAPSYENLIELAAVAIIRTFLNYFLNREIKENLELLKLKTEDGTPELNDNPNPKK
jgi:uncharacterized membrane protein